MDLAGVGENAEALLGGGEAQRLVQADEADTLGVFAAPYERGSQLQRAAGPQRVDGEDAEGARAHFFGRLNLEAASPELLDENPRGREFGLGNELAPLQIRQGLDALQDGAPPEGDVRISLEK